jgi:hypothetical protein
MSPDFELAATYRSIVGLTNPKQRLVVVICTLTLFKGRDLNLSAEVAELMNQTRLPHGTTLKEKHELTILITQSKCRPGKNSDTWTIRLEARADNPSGTGNHNMDLLRIEEIPRLITRDLERVLINAWARRDKKAHIPKNIDLRKM